MRLFRDFLAVSVLAAATVGKVSAGPLDLYVSSDALDTTTMYNGVSGAQMVDPFTVVAGGASGPLGLHFAPDGNRMLVGNWTGGLNEFDGTTGAYIKSYNGGAPSTNWAGIYAPNGEVYAGDWDAGAVRRYDATTGAFLGDLASVPEPSDMRIGPNGNLYVCSFANDEGVYELDVNTGAVINHWNTPTGTNANDIAFLPNGLFMVTTMQHNGSAANLAVWVYHPNLATPIHTFTHDGWGRPHGIEVSPHDGNIYVVDGYTNQVHVFDSSTFDEIDTAFLSPAPSAKIVDLDFRPVPEPAAGLLLLAAGLIGLLRRRRQ